MSDLFGIDGPLRSDGWWGDHTGARHEGRSSAARRGRHGIKTDGVDAAVRNVVAEGGVVVAEPRDDTHERRSVVRDDHGNALVPH